MARMDGDYPLGGPGEIVEVDEALIGGKATGKGSGRDKKTVVLGTIERGGELVTRIVPDPPRISLWAADLHLGSAGLDAAHG